MSQPIGRYLDDDDALFNWLHSVAIGLPVLHFACGSGLADALAEGPVNLASFARTNGLPQDKVRRLGSYLVAHELAAQGADDTVAPNARTARMAELHGLWRQMINTTAAGATLLPALQAGKTGFEQRFGMPVFDYFSAHPRLAAEFASFMSFMTSRTLAFLHANYAFEPFEVAADIGGSEGGLLASVLERRREARGILFDLPDVAERARASIADPRIEVVGGSFFEAVPAADLYLLKQILHDWSDDECVRILGNIRAAIAPGGRVVVLDHLASEPPRPDEARSTDIAMMIWATGRERTAGEFAKLFARAGFAPRRMVENPSGHSLVEAIPSERNPLNSRRVQR